MQYTQFSYLWFDVVKTQVIVIHNSYVYMKRGAQRHNHLL